MSVLNAAVTSDPGKVILVAHSLGCLLVAHWACIYPKSTGRIWSALLVTPPEVERSQLFDGSLRRFAAKDPLSFPSVLVGSENDQYMMLEAAYKLAIRWGSRFVNAGEVGHINPDSGHGPWPEGEALLLDLIK